MRRKKERSKQGQTNKQGKATQHVYVFVCVYFKQVHSRETVELGLWGQTRVLCVCVPVCTCMCINYMYNMFTCMCINYMYNMYVYVYVDL